MMASCIPEASTSVALMCIRSHSVSFFDQYATGVHGTAISVSGVPAVGFHVTDRCSNTAPLPLPLRHESTWMRKGSDVLGSCRNGAVVSSLFTSRNALPCVSSFHSFSMSRPGRRRSLSRLVAVDRPGMYSLL